MNVQAAGGYDTGFAGGLYRCVVGALNLRTTPSLSGHVVGAMREGALCWTLDAATDGQI